MTARSTIVGFVAVTVFIVLMGAPEPAAAQPPPVPGTHRLLADFEDGWDAAWTGRKLSRSANESRVATDEDGNRSLEFTSHSAASGMWRKFHLKPVANGRLSWRWRIENSLPGEADEKTKDGDDYAARVYVVLSKPLLPWKTRAICYVWAANEPVGAIYRNPYAKNVGTIVLQSGGDRAGEWIAEERDVVADHISIFGNPPKEILAFAVMVDTDDTDTQVRAWFDDLTFVFE